MKAGNLGLWTTGGILAYFAWIFVDMASPPSAGDSSPIAEVRSSELPVLVEFYADWCGPCKFIAPEVEKLATELTGKAEVIRINAETDRAAAAAHRVRAYPTFIAFRHGKETSRQTGAIPRSQMKAMLGL
ncbi:MAG TPA: thioredoxin domain-containing protein [Prosthecobacter sp.]|nr:thioredoxin domain-containing protein [Prosthecobacter sp.]